MVKAGDKATISLEDDADGRRRRAGAPSLILVMTASAPGLPSASISLEGVDHVRVGRGPRYRVVRTASRELAVELADPAMSSSHARLTRVERGWAIADDASKNGTLVNGRRVIRAELAPDDLVELGSSFFVVCPCAAEADPALPLRTWSAPFAQDLQLLTRIARARVPVLFLGETGTGKELLARATHELSGREGPFVAINCGAIPATLIESELFGARKGAYTGASADRTGAVVEAHKGTLFLDEIAELPEPSQAALLRVLQDGEVVALGGTRSVRVDVRVVAATHQNLMDRVAARRFRNDLYARVRGHVMTLRPLRKRREDLGLLLAELLRRVAGDRAADITIAPAAARAILMHDWPHNVRELEHVAARAVALLDDGRLRLEHLPDDIAERARTGSRRNHERTRLVQLVRRHTGNLSAVARDLATSRAQVHRLLRRQGIDPAELLAGSGAVESSEGT
jgi:transcriptional regulator with AAA-type ATPase domain